MHAPNRYQCFKTQLSALNQSLGAATCHFNSRMGLSEDFEAAAERMSNTTGPNNDEMLELYALFKQSKVGDNTTAKPGLLDLKGKKKWDAWNTKKGMSSEDAMRAYIELADSLLAKYAPQTAPA